MPADGRSNLGSQLKRGIKGGFRRMGLEPEFWDPATGRLTQVNGVVFRPDP